MSFKRNFLSLAIATVLLCPSLTSCGEGILLGQGAPQTETGNAEIISENCSFGIIIEYDGSPAAATRMDALETMSAMLTHHLNETQATQNPPAIADQLKDPIRLASAIRGIAALKEVLRSAEESKQPSDPIEVIATTSDGQELARGTITVQHDGSYVVDVLSAAGFQSDGPQCK